VVEPILIRQAADAASACDVLRRSIRDLCAPDHGDDPTVLGAWLGNKTPDSLARWIGAPGSRVLVAVEDHALIGVGAIDADGRITLNYVAPEARFRGVSKAMLCALEECARAAGVTRCTLESTTTAHRFYLAAGYAAAGDPVPAFGAFAFPMAKALAGR
jgi:GNAT superfamily N-acetyltransferase